MNLVAKEYVASKREPGGVLILSEMAGSSREMREALTVNPHDVEEVVAAIARAVTMPPEEQAFRIRAMQERLRRYDARTWAMRFLERLDEAVRFSEDLAVKILSEGEQNEIRLGYRKGNRRLLLLDYDGTLVPFSPDRDAVSPTERVVRVLKDLVSDSANHVVVVSGRPRDILDKWFGGLALTLIAEHGGWVRDRGDSEWKATLSLDGSWKGRVRPVIERYLDRGPGSSLEGKDFGAAWPYPAPEPEAGAVAAQDLA